MKIEYNTNKSAELLIIFKDEDIVRYSFEKRRVQDKEPVYNKMRVNSIAEQSTRYCNYSREKFGGEVTFVKPVWSELPVGQYGIKQGYPREYYKCGFSDRRFINYLLDAEYFYLDYTKDGWQPQQARETLPLATATEVVYTAFEDDWEHFFDLRLWEITGKVHPNAKQVAQLAWNKLEKYGLTRNMERH